METHPVFPAELEPEIFETAARLHPSVIPVLLRIARRTLLWIEPLLYEVVDLTNLSSTHIAVAILRGATSNPPAPFLRGVRHVLPNGADMWTFEQTRTILTLCTGVIDFAYGGPLDHTYLPILSTLPLRRLSVHLSPLFEGPDRVDFAHPLFASLTHLDVYDPRSDFCGHVALAPALTHLRMPGGVHLAWHMADSVLAACPRLTVLVALVAHLPGPSANKWVEHIPITDIRFVVQMYSNYARDWVAAAHGRPDFWSVAEDFVARKRRKQIDASIFCLFRPRTP
ncbi:hypothetical protein B0H15DRAFT_560136 [Mycena belliarum]|uniref:Uncharacterized protein n=1 Tax=Mycena belliarum TaxID=1033014 RepID=A0AAD6TVC4_9AGAR|nr:hypothetical protein B0H15DRAFT_560136 [Mycena belliae]